MLDIVDANINLPKDQKIHIVLNEAHKVIADIFKNRFKDQNLSLYKFSLDEISAELALEKELIIQLVEDYILQIFKACDSFNEILSNIKNKQNEEKNFIDLYNLAHKNLGVAKNLRIKDAQVLLNDLMQKNHDINHLEDCVKALQACAFKLNPNHSYNVMLLKNLKSSL